MARISADEIDGGSVATPSRVQTDYGNRGQVTPALSPEQISAAAALADARADQAAALANARVTAQTTGGTVDAQGYVVPKDPLRDRSNPPTAPAGQHYTWIGGTTTGSWQLYSDTSTTGGAGAGASSDTGKKAIGTSQYTDANGNTIIVTTFSDGTTTNQNVGLSGDTKAARQNVFDSVTALFKEYGILKTDPTTGKLDAVSQALSNQINSLAMSGAGSDTISIQLQQTDAYKQRFIGNELRRNQGLNVLDPATYLALENQYTGILQAAGVPASFYNSPKALGNIIGNDISASELQTRANLAVASVQNADPYYTQTLQNYYGLKPGDMVAHLLDPKAALPILQEQVGSAQIGAEAARQGLAETVANTQYLYGAGVTQAQAQAGYKSVAEVLPTAQKLSNIYGAQTGINYNQQEATNQYLLNSGAATLEQRKLNQLEQAQFSGQSGVTTAVNPLQRAIQGSF
jgi:hypothetical protein